MKRLKNIAIIILLLFASGNLIAQGGPKAVAIEPTKDVGKFHKGDKLEHEFIIKNEGNAPLAVTNVVPACGCTTASFDKLIDPGKTGKIKVNVDVSLLNGPISKGIAVYTNDPGNPQLQLTIAAHILSYLTAKPGYARFMTVKGETDAAFSKQLIASTDSTNFEITGVENELNGIKLSYKETDPSERLPGVAGKQWTVQITVANDIAVGPLSGYVYLKTNHPKQKTVEIPVSGFIRPTIAVTPLVADFGELTVTEPVKKIINVRSFATEPIAVTAAECNIKGITVELESLTAGREYLIRIRIDPSIARGSFAGKLIIHTDSNKAAIVEVPVKGVIN